MRAPCLGVVSHPVSGQSAVSEASRAAESARSDVSASNELAATLVDTMSRGSSRYQSSNRSSGRAVSSVEEIGQSADRIPRDLRSGFKRQTSRLPKLLRSHSSCPAALARQNQPDQGERDGIGWQGLQQQPDGGRAEGGE